MNASKLRALVAAKSALLSGEKLQVIFGGARFPATDIIFDPQSDDPVEIPLEDHTTLFLEHDAPFGFVVIPPWASDLSTLEGIRDLQG